MEIKKKKKNNYVNNPDFYQALVNYKGRNNFEDCVPNYIGECISEICRRLSSKPNFAGYTYRDEMVGDAIENCIGSVDGFDPLKSKNPFAYFTQIAWNAMLRRIAKEKKQTYLKHKNLQHMYSISGDNTEFYVTSQEISDSIIDSFEVKIKKPKKINKIKEII
jgi:hypothetical protein